MSKCKMQQMLKDNNTQSDNFYYLTEVLHTFTRPLKWKKWKVVLNNKHSNIVSSTNNKLILEPLL